MIRFLLFIVCGWLAYRFAQRLTRSLRSLDHHDAAEDSQVIEAEYRVLSDDDDEPRQNAS